MIEAGTAKLSLNGSANYSQFKLLLILTFFSRGKWTLFKIVECICNSYKYAESNN